MNKVNVLDRATWIVTVSDVVTPDECRELIDLTEKSGYGAAPITTEFGFIHAPQVRNNGRVMIDDTARAAWLWERVRAHVPAERDGGRAVGLNERFRYYRYEPGQYFRWHYDGCFERSREERSLLTLMVYLNGDLLGGETEFDTGLDEDPLRVRPETGKALLFEHHVRHQGAPVLDGVKYVLRTDVMYRSPG
jgi:prolyl 4-hydroxylase